MNKTIRLSKIQSEVVQKMRNGCHIADNRYVKKSARLFKGNPRGVKLHDFVVKDAKVWLDKLKR